MDDSVESGAKSGTTGAGDKRKNLTTGMELYRSGVVKLSEVKQWERVMRSMLHQLPQIEAGSSFALMSELLKDFPTVPEPPATIEDIHALQLRREGNIAIITINRPTKANAYNTEILQTLRKLIDQLSQEHAAAVIFTSSNPTFWCSGADLERVANPGAREAIFMLSQDTFDALANAPFASIAVMEGSAVAG